jgi:hypothetical protein
MGIAAWHRPVVAADATTPCLPRKQPLHTTLQPAVLAGDAAAQPHSVACRGQQEASERMDPRWTII